MDISVDIRPLFGPARDQGPRQTCLAFATSAAHEFALKRREHLSVDYLYGRAVDRSHKDLTAGVTPASITDALDLDGQPDEPHLPYSLDIATLAARIAAVTAPRFRRRPAFRDAKLAEVFTQLDARQPVLMVLRISLAFNRLDANATVRARSPDRDTGVHAIVAVGYGIRAGERFLLIRNSWGAEWGENGHAWIAESYAEPRLMRVGTV